MYGDVCLWYWEFMTVWIWQKGSVADWVWHGGLAGWAVCVMVVAIFGRKDVLQNGYGSLGWVGLCVCVWGGGEL